MIPLIIEVALNGVTRKDRNPAVPESPEEIAADAIACLDAGATIVHSHISLSFVGDYPPEVVAAEYREAYQAILAERPGVIIYPTTSGGSTIEHRYEHHRILANEGLIRQGVGDPGVINLTSFGEDGLPRPSDRVVGHTANDVRYIMSTCAELGIGPNMAVFEPGWLRMALGFHRSGTLPPGAFAKFYFSGERSLAGLGYPTFSPPPILEAFELYAAMVGDADLSWAVALLGGDILSTPIAEQAIRRGGHVRVGLEDDMDAESNVVAVERVVALSEHLGRPVATTADAYSILGLPHP